MATPRSWRWLVAVVLLIAAAAAAFFALRPRTAFKAPVSVEGLDLSRPDLLIRSQSLSALPADLVRAPLLRDIVTEDLALYYESHPALLSVSGTARRLAFDHGLSITERIVATALAAPAELALWRNARGQPDRFLLRLDHGLASRAIVELAKVALPDRQLSIAGELANGVRLYAVQWSRRDTWLFASRGDRAVVLSSPGMVLDAAGAIDPSAGVMIGELLDGKEGMASALAESFGLAARDPSTRHDLAARSGLVAFGYEHFFPGLDALRLRADANGQWTGSVRVAGKARDRWLSGAPALWAGLPRDSALCAVLPWRPELARPIAEPLLGERTAALIQAVDANAALCWNDAGGLFAPMLATRLTDSGGRDIDGLVGPLLDAALRKSAQTVSNPDAVPDSGSGSGNDLSTSIAATGRTGPQAGLDQRAFEAGGQTLTIDGLNNSRLWLRAVEHPLGPTRHDGRRGHGVAVARLDKLLLASVDARSLQPAVAVAAGHWPALSDDASPAGQTPILAVDGPRLAAMLDATIWRTLAPRRTPTFHRVARALLAPRLKAVADLGRVRIALASANPGAPDAAAGSEWLALQATRVTSTATPGEASSGRLTPAPVPAVSPAR